MDYLKAPQKELKKQIAQLQQLVNQELLSNENLIRKKIRDRWLLGKDPDGNEIGIYSKSQIGAEYAFFKNKINPLAGVWNVDLTLTGALGKGIKVKLTSNNI